MDDPRSTYGGGHRPVTAKAIDTIPMMAIEVEIH